MGKVIIASTFEAKAIKVVRELLSKGKNDGLLDPQRYTNMRVVISKEKPSNYKHILTTIPTPEDLKEILKGKDIYIVM